ncbi:MAG: bifunctional oligoribonuclease/PAP phosphatase NrnA [Paenibacillaceae bacterium]|nr:bifunctional oligoribonuclease/PAP phosphatase NrnA [Paenibacillaceae bacterium]
MSSEATTPYREQLAEAARFLRDHDDYLVVSHVTPDGDAVSSTLAAGLMLQQLGKRYVMINEGNSPRKFDYLSGYESIVNYSATAVDRTFANVISVDCADFKRVGTVSKLFANEVSLLNIDHHPTNDAFGSANLLRFDAAATAEILYDLAYEIGARWTKELSDCIYTGLLTDTGGFRYANTTPKVLQIASEMLQYGVNGNELADHLLEKLSYSHVALLRKALTSLAFTDDKRIAWVQVSAADIEEAQASNEDLEGLVNYPRNIEGVEVGLLFKQVVPDRYKVSMRSAGLVDVSAIAKSFGGGGHVRAAGCTLVGELSEIVDRVVTAVAKELS